MKLLFLADKPLPSERPTGIGVAAFDMAAALARRGNQVYYICRGNGDEIAYFDRNLTIRKIAHFSRENLKATAQTLGSVKSDIVHVHSSAALPSLLLAKFLGHVVVQHAHGFEPLVALTPTLRRAVGMKMASFVVATADSVKREVARNYRMPLHKIATVYNGVDCETFRPSAKSSGILSKYDLQLFDKMILSVGALTPGKGQWRMIDALPTILASWPNLVFVIVGPTYDQRYAERIMERARFLGTAKSVRMLGLLPRTELTEMINSADFCVHLSTREGGADDMAVLEEMACGKTVIAFRQVVPPRTIDHDVDGLLVDSRDNDELIRAVTALLRDPGLCERLGRAARDKAISKFGWNQTASSLEAIYRNLLS